MVQGAWRMARSIAPSPHRPTTDLVQSRDHTAAAATIAKLRLGVHVSAIALEHAQDPGGGDGCCKCWWRVPLLLLLLLVVVVVVAALLTLRPTDPTPNT